MSRNDGKSKFYRMLDVPKDIKLLLRIYNRVLRKQALNETKGTNNGSSGKTYC